jgi:hypothetical protein
MIPFQSKFNDWLETCLHLPIPDEVIAYNFNLSEPWCIEFVGCVRYDTDDHEWACDEAYWPDQRWLELPSEVFGNHRESVLAQSINLLNTFLESDNTACLHLKKAEIVAIGFIDGDLHQIWPTLDMGSTQP